MRELATLGVDAALVGEALVTASDPAAKLRELREAGQ
jgi:indole-3-glycerol phosphate synthase